VRRPEWECWPDLRVTVRPLPWTWHVKPRWYVDDLGWRAHTSVAWLFVTVEWWGQDSDHPLFPMVDDAAGSPAVGEP